MSGNNIKVVCRFRPQNKLEIREGGVPIIDIDEDGTQVTLKVKKKKAQFDYNVHKIHFAFLGGSNQ